MQDFNNFFISFDIFYNLYLYLDIKSIYQLFRTCKLYYDIYINNNQIWKKYLFGIININDQELLWNDDYRQTYIVLKSIN